MVLWRHLRTTHRTFRVLLSVIITQYYQDGQRTLRPNDQLLPTHSLPHNQNVRVIATQVHRHLTLILFVSLQFQL